MGQLGRTRTHEPEGEKKNPGGSVQGPIFPERRCSRTTSRRGSDSEPVAALNTHGRDRHGIHPGNRSIPTDGYFPKPYNPYKTHKSPETALFDFVHHCGVFGVLPFRLTSQAGLKSKLTRFCVQGTTGPHFPGKETRQQPETPPDEGQRLAAMPLHFPGRERLAATVGVPGRGQPKNSSRRGSGSAAMLHPPMREPPDSGEKGQLGTAVAAIPTKPIF